MILSPVGKKIFTPMIERAIQSRKDRWVLDIVDILVGSVAIAGAMVAVKQMGVFNTFPSTRWTRFKRKVRLIWAMIKLIWNK